MLNVVRPVELDEHIVVTLLEVLVLFPSVTILAHLTILIHKAFLVSVRVLNLGNDKADVRVVVIDRTIEAAFIRLIDAQVVVTTWS